MSTPYYFYKRPEVLTQVPAEARKVLDIGCAAGELGLSIKERQPCHVTGIEIVPEIAAMAIGKIDEVLVGDAISLMENMPDGCFDAVIMADVLEHVADHEGLLRQVRRKLAVGGKLVLSVPNVAHWSILSDLIQGCWTYQDQGILDRTHLRFFTRRSILDTLLRNGFTIQSLGGTSLTGAEPPAGLRESLGAFGLNVENFAVESIVYQYIIVSTPSAA